MDQSRPAKMRATDIAYSRLRRDLLDGRWPKGTHLGEVELSAQLGMSRTPIREALRRLATESLLIFEPHLGATVPGWSRHDIDEIFSIRLNLEGLAAELAALNATVAQIEELDRLARAMETAAEQRARQIVPLTEINDRFHRVIVEASDSQRLARLIEQATELPLVVRTFARYDDRAMRRSVAHHTELVEAIRARDPDWARAVMEAHLRAGKEVMVSGFPTDSDAAG